RLRSRLLAGGLTLHARTAVAPSRASIADLAPDFTEVNDHLIASGDAQHEATFLAVEEDPCGPVACGEGLEIEEALLADHRLHDPPADVDLEPRVFGGLRGSIPHQKNPALEALQPAGREVDHASAPIGDADGPLEIGEPPVDRDSARVQGDPALGVRG